MAKRIGVINTANATPIQLFSPPFMWDTFQSSNLKLIPLPDLISARCNEKLNGERILTIQYRLNGLNNDQLKVGKLIKAKVNPWLPAQAMRIYSVNRKLQGRRIEVKAEPVINELRGKHVYQFNTTNKAESMGDVIMSVATPPIGKTSGGYNRYYFDTEHTEERSGLLLVPQGNALELYGGVKGSLLDVWGGELEKDNHYMNHYKRIGSDTGYVIQYGSNLTDITVSYDSSNVIRGVAAYFRRPDPSDSSHDLLIFADGYGDEDTGYLALNPYGTAKNNELATVHVMDVTDKEDWDSIATEAQRRQRLMKYAREWITQNQSTVSDPSINIQVDFIHLKGREEYKEFINLQSLRIGDTVYIKSPDFNTDVPVRIIGYDYDLMAARFVTMELGQPQKKYIDKMAENMLELRKRTESNWK